MKFVTLLMVTAFAVSITTTSAAEPAGFQPGRYIGYWNDGSGVVRDATPVTSWRDFVYKSVQQRNWRGHKETVAKPDRSTGDQSENIVWQVPHYNYCNGGMIMVKGKLFGLSDRAGMGFNLHREADFTGALLTCFDPATGNEEWKVDLHHWDLVPNGKELQQVLKEYNRDHPKRYLAWCNLTLALGYKKDSKLNQQGYAPLRDAFNAVAEKPAPDTVEEAFKSKSIRVRGYLQTTYHGRTAREHFPTDYSSRQRLEKEGGYLMDPWYGCLNHLGFNMQTPVSDGEHIYISTAFGAVFCVDLNGKVIWKHWFGGGFARGWAIASPVLVGDKLMVNGVDPSKQAGRAGYNVRVAMNKKDGTVLWTQNEIGSGAYHAAPAILSLPVAGADSERMDVLLYPDGDVLRAEDGKRIATGIGGGGHARPWAIEGTRIAQVVGVADGGAYKKVTQFDKYKKQLIVVELEAPSRDKVTAKLLWADKRCDRYSYGIIMKDDKLYWFNHKDRRLFVRDAKTGKEIASCSGPECKVAFIRSVAFHTPYIAGRYYLALNDDGTCGVIDLGEDGASPKPVVINRLSRPTDKHVVGMFNYGAQMVVSGNRIFVRSNEILYCIGDPNAEMVLSEVHR